MVFSKYNIFSKIRNSDNYFIINLLSGNADILNSREAEKIVACKNGKTLESIDLLKSMSEKGYIINEDIEEKLFREKYLDFLDSRETDEIQIFYVPGYSCNFSCSYCFQDEYLNTSGTDSAENENEIIDAFFNYIHAQFAGRKKYITLFGGEPLLNSAKQKLLISYFLQKATDADLEICIVTNGYTLTEYMDILKLGNIREIQVTLDGTEQVHNARRNLKNGSGTFKRIVDGIDRCFQNKYTVNLRMVADKENIANLPDLASFAINRGWTKLKNFKTHIGRNYELHHCQSAPEKLFNRISLYETIYELIQQHPYILEFYQPAYSVSKFLSENGQLPNPLFDSCPACKTEWAFDFTGNIYSCTATVGKSGEALGTFYPEVSLNTNLINDWERRDVVSIEECSSCNLQLACGGGCGAISKNKSGGICSSDCRPVKELLELGFSAYCEQKS